MVNKSKLVRLLLALAETVASSTDEEITALGKAGVSRLFTDVPRSNKSLPKQGSTKEELDGPQIDDLIETIQRLSSRQDGIALLTEMSFRKRLLERIARKIDVPVFREDTSKRLIEKIVESTIGPRLNAEAIRGELSHR